jgi:tRNA pseudouridine55 synthase
MTTRDGLLLIDKPADWTSHDVVGRVRRLAGTRRVGHAGTLDPMATGLLVVGVGRGTRLLTFLVGCDKTYVATVRLGQATVTDDADGEVTTTADVAGIGVEAVRRAAAALTGRIEQVPSSVSAVKVAGQRAYARVRAGQEVTLAARTVTVGRFDVGAAVAGWSTSSDAAPGRVLDVPIEVDVSSGTYVRALARDLGAALGVGGHLTTLRRTRVGPYPVESAHTLVELGDALQAGDGIPLLPLAEVAAAALAVRELTEAEAIAVGFGQRIDSAQPQRPEPVAALGPDGALVAILDESAPRARARVVFTPGGS